MKQWLTKRRKDKSIEVFANDGEVVMTAQLFPSEKDDDIVFFSNGIPVVFENVNCWLMKSSW